MPSKAEIVGADYDPIAWFYDHHWCSHYHPWALAMLERTLLCRIPEGARVLDVCCGNGVIARELAGRGYQVTGIDTSEQMLRFARTNAPSASFVRADARSFGLPGQFEAAISTFDSLNHVLSSADLRAVFRNVWRSLTAGGHFVFDMNLKRRYLDFWSGTCSSVDDQHACFIRGDYDPKKQTARTQISLFRRNGHWQRDDVVLYQRCHPVEEVIALLLEVGFAQAACLDASRDLQLEGDFGVARGVFVAAKTGASSI